MKIETKRLQITELRLNMAEDISRNSLDEDTRRFTPDEVFATPEEASETIAFLLICRMSGNGPQVLAVQLQDGTNIGYVQAVPLEDTDQWEIGYHIGEAYRSQGYAAEAVQAVPLEDTDQWEIGYHIGEAYRSQGYAAEAVQAFLPEILPALGISEIAGICLSDNLASRKVLERCGFVLEKEGPGPYQGSVQPICRYLYHA